MSSLDCQDKKVEDRPQASLALEIYPIILNCEELKKGLYHYNVKENLMEMLLEENLSKWLIQNTGGEKWVTNSAVIFVITE